MTPATGSGSGTYNPGTYYPGSGSGSDSTVKRTLPTVSVRASVRPDTATRGALIIDKKDIVVSGCVSPVIKNLQWSGHRGAYMYAFETDSAGRYVYNTDSLGLDNLEETVAGMLEDIQKDMLERAKAHLEAHTYTARTKEEFLNIFEEKAGFVKAMWCGETE